MCKNFILRLFLRNKCSLKGATRYCNIELEAVAECKDPSSTDKKIKKKTKQNFR